MCHVSLMIERLANAERVFRPTGAARAWIDTRNGAALLAIGHPTHGMSYPVGVSVVVCAQRRAGMRCMSDYEVALSQQLNMTGSETRR